MKILCVLYDDHKDGMPKKLKNIKKNIIDPVCDSKLTGIHTFSHEKKLTVLDGKLKRRKL